MGGGGGGGDTPEVTYTADQYAQEQINAKLWNYYQESYKPIVQRYISKVSDSEVTSEEERKIAGQLNAETMKNVTADTAGSNPVETEKKLLHLAKVETGAQVQGQGAVRSRKLGELQSIVDIGQGQATTAQAGIGELASQSLQAEISNMDIQNQEQAAIENAYGSMAGALAAGLVKGTQKTTPTKRTISYEG